MRIIKYTPQNLYARISVMRLAGVTNTNIKRLDDFLRGNSVENVNDSKNMLQADRCLSFIEGIKKYEMPIDSEDIIVTLLTLFPHNMMEETVLKAEFPKEMVALREILDKNIAEDVPVFSAAQNVLNFVSFSKLVKSNTLAAIYLIANLMIVRSGVLIVLEDTDSVSPDIILGIQCLVADYV